MPALIGVERKAWHTGRRRDFSETQLGFARKLTTLATLALENARLYEREHRIAQTLQEAILTPPEPVDGLEIAYLYRPASAAADVGGDFYDVVPSNPTRWPSSSGTCRERESTQRVSPR